MDNQFMDITGVAPAITPRTEAAVLAPVAEAEAIVAQVPITLAPEAAVEVVPHRPRQVFTKMRPMTMEDLAACQSLQAAMANKMRIDEEMEVMRLEDMRVRLRMAEFSGVTGEELAHLIIDYRIAETKFRETKASQFIRLRDEREFTRLINNSILYGCFAVGGEHNGRLAGINALTEMSGDDAVKHFYALPDADETRPLMDRPLVDERLIEFLRPGRAGYISCTMSDPLFQGTGIGSHMMGGFGPIAVGLGYDYTLAEIGPVNYSAIAGSKHTSDVSFMCAHRAVDCVGVLGVNNRVRFLYVTALLNPEMKKVFTDSLEEDTVVKMNYGVEHSLKIGAAAKVNPREANPPLGITQEEVDSMSETIHEAGDPILSWDELVIFHQAEEDARATPHLVKYSPERLAVHNKNVSHAGRVMAGRDGLGWGARY